MPELDAPKSSGIHGVLDGSAQPVVATTDRRYGGHVNALVLHFFIFTVAGWIHRDRQDVIEYLREENRVLREQFGNKRLRLTDDQRRRLAVRAKALGRAALRGLSSIVTPDTRLAWYRPPWGAPVTCVRKARMIERIGIWCLWTTLSDSSTCSGRPRHKR